MSFQDRGAAAGLDKIGRRTDALKMKFAGLQAGAAQMGRGFGQLAMGLAPFSLGLLAVIKQGAAFEQSIAKLQSKMLGGYDPALRQMAKTLGATTVFSATQAADAMTMLAQSGFTAKEVMAAVPGVLAAAAAEGMTLAQAADIVASNVRAFGISATESARVAGILALASSRANTNMIALQEGLKMSAPIAGIVHAKLSDVAAVLGALADVGLKGTLSGTAFRAGMTKLLKPTKETRVAISKLGISMGSLNSKLDKGDVVGTFQSIIGKLAKIPKLSQRASLAVKIFGVRGVALANALKQGPNQLARFNKTLKDLREESGKTAERMAAIQLNTLTGQFTLLKSAAEGVSIELFDMMAKDSALGVKSFAGAVGHLALALQVVNGKTFTDPKMIKQVKEISPAIMDIAQGIKVGFGEAKMALGKIIDGARSLGKILGLDIGGTGVSAVAATTTKFVLLAAVIAPIGGALLLVTKIAGGLFNVVAGGVRMIGGATRLIIGGVGGIASKIPILAKVIPGLGKVVGGIESLTAMPVRVTNFHEMAAITAASAAISGTSTAAVVGAGLFARFSGALTALVLKIPLIGTALAGSFGGLTLVATTLAGKLAIMAGLTAVFAAIGAAGWALGTWLDKKFGMSSALANLADRWLPKWLGGGNQEGADRRNKAAAQSQSFNQAQQMAQQLVRFQRAGTAVSLNGAAGPKTTLDRNIIEQRISQYLRTQNYSQAQIATALQNLSGTLQGVKPTASTKPVVTAKDAQVTGAGLLPVSPGDLVLDRAVLASAVTSQHRGGMMGRTGLSGSDSGSASPPPARGGGAMTISVPISLDGRQIALAVAEVRLDDIERSGGRLEPGDRGALLTRGFLGGAQ